MSRSQKKRKLNLQPNLKKKLKKKLKTNNRLKKIRKLRMMEMKQHKIQQRSKNLAISTKAVKSSKKLREHSPLKK